jgi:hypothetical protein
METEGNLMAKIEGEGLDLILGDAPISRFMFGTSAKRRKVPQLREDGWPIFDCAGKNAARPSSLRDEVAKRERASVAAQHTGRAA